MRSPAPSDKGIFTKKSVDTVIHQNDAPARTGEGQLKRKLGMWDLVGVGIGMVIGTGIFTLTGIEAKNHAGPAVVISFLIAGIVAMLAALCYAELASAVPTAGSAYTYAYVTAGEIFAWVIAWDLILEFALGASVVARGWSGYLGNLLDLWPQWFGESSTINVGAVIITVVLGTIAALGIRESKAVTNALVLIKVTICVFVIVLGVWFVRASNWFPFVPASQPAPESSTHHGLAQPLWQALSGIEPNVFGIGGILMATAIVFFSYSGFELMANMGEEARNPAHDMPRAIIIVLSLCTALYMGVSLVVTGMIHYRNLDEGAPIADAFRQMGVGWAAGLIAIAALCGLTSVILIDIMGMGRIFYAMSRDGLIPAAVGRVHPRTGTPLGITIVITAAVAVISGTVPLTELADMVSIGTLFAFLIVSVAVAVLRRTRPDLERPFRVPGAPWLPILAALLCLGLMCSLSVMTWIRFLVWLAIGLLIYVFYGRRHSRAHQAAQSHEA
ncbi:amino acid permease [Nanchangia anserum]|uniref:Amino acid permease n=2 Tax=Nanchangia anserum TaxID=2692125 RepID=A0A8I0KPE4_9ACTO|nr:amino acid permease [Nanchangia anserum]QOX82606.1 amino acid permease [Nanchangia anserum]